MLRNDSGLRRRIRRRATSNASNKPRQRRLRIENLETRCLLTGNSPGTLDLDFGGGGTGWVADSEVEFRYRLTLDTSDGGIIAVGPSEIRRELDIQHDIAQIVP